MSWKITSTHNHVNTCSSKFDRGTEFSEDRLLYADCFVLFLDMERSLYSLAEIGGDILSDISEDQLMKEIETIKDMIRKRRKKRKIRLRLYVSQIPVLLNLLRKYDIKYDVREWRSKIHTPTGDIEGVPYRVVTDFFEVVDYECLCRTAPKDIDSMLYFMSLEMGDKTWKALRRSQASNGIRVFYSDIGEECLEDKRKHKRYIKTKEGFDDLKAGCLAGYKGMTASLVAKVLKDVESWDKTSAYPSVFVSYDRFPVGKIVRHKKNQWGVLRRCLRTGEWFQIVIKEDTLVMAYNHLDIIFLRKTGELDFVNRCLEKFQWVIYTSTEEGYLCDAFRKKIVDVWTLKDQEDDSERKRFYKLQVDFLYGKGAERCDFETDEEVFRYLASPERYILPHWSRIVVSYLRLEILEALTMIGEERQVAYNTDGIKCFDSREVFDILNKRIAEKNALAGFSGCKIGFWKFEYRADKFLQIDKDKYIYEIDGDLHTKIPGIPKDQLIKAIEGDPFEWFLHPHLMSLDIGWIYDSYSCTYKKRTYEGYLYRPLTMTREEAIKVVTKKEMRTVV